MVLTEEWVVTAISTIFTLGSRGGISAVEIFKIVNNKKLQLVIFCNNLDAGAGQMHLNFDKVVSRGMFKVVQINYMTSFALRFVFS